MRIVVSNGRPEETALLKNFSGVFFKKVLIPLHKVKTLASFNAQL
jgi:hypothetical protein